LSEILLGSKISSILDEINIYRVFPTMNFQMFVGKTKGANAMSKQIGFLKFVKSKGNLYVYLVKAFREKNKTKNVIIHGFGKMPQALENLYEWRDEFEGLFPKKLIDAGYDWHDLQEWVLSLETGYSKSGRKLMIADKVFS
jgi:hypothetical protein